MIEPQPGDFRLRKMGGDFSIFIRALQWLNGDGFADFEHVDVYLGGDLFAQAWIPKARIVRNSMDRDDVFWSSGIIDLTPCQRTAVVNAAVGYVTEGVGYSYLDYLELTLHRFGVNLPGLKGAIASTGHMICSQFVDQCYMDAGVHLFQDGRWPGYVTPGDLTILLRSKGAV